MIDELDATIAAVDTARGAGADAALDEAMTLSRTLSGQAKNAPTATSVLTEQRNALRTSLSTVVTAIVEPITDHDVAAQAGQIADIWAAQRTLFEQGMSVVELTAVLRGESPTAPDTEIWNFLAILRAEAALIDAPARRYRADDQHIATIGAQLTDRTDLLRRSLGRPPDQATLEQLKQSLFASVVGYTGAVTTASTELRAGVASKSDALRAAAWRDTAVVAVLLLGGIAVAAAVALSLLTPLRRLRAGARQIARRDLPAAVERIKVGDDPASVPTHRIDVHTDEELGQLARAVDDIHDQALRLAGEQAHLRLQMRSMFETLARRNKSLIDLQLKLIETLERDERDPTRLEHLFRLDHLAARLRRNGENLLILAGDHDRRTRQAPIGFGDIVRAAISEVESYQRVQVRPAPSGALTGSVAVDLVHILAELVDNALRFSPPESTVMIGFARTIEGGTVISVVDHGIGISRDDVSAINTRLATRADATADTTRHMGLFVVGQLAARHRVTVQLTATTPVARNGGVTATVDIPGQLLVSPAEIERRPAAPAATLFALASPRDEHPPTASLPPPPVPPVPSPALPVRVRPVQSNLSGASESGDGESAEPARGSGPDSETVSTASSPRHLRTSAYTPPVPAAVTDDEGVTTPIFFGMVSEWLTDPATPRSRPGPEWVSPADAGWSAARHAAHAPVENRTESGLPQRVPGDRIVPGGLDGVGAARRRDPDAIRENLTRHLAGVRNGRSTSRPT